MIWLLCGLSLFLGFSVQTVAWAGVVEEYQVKAAFFYHFSRFIQWPSEKFSSEGDPFRVCIVGGNPFQGELQKILSGKTVQDHPFVLIQDPSDSELHQCHVVFIGKGAAKQSEGITRAMGGQGVLTIGESPDFIQRGGIVRLFLEESKVRFGINPKAAEQAKLVISSKLLRLATIESP
jgi:YfiR/HmsC-like